MDEITITVEGDTITVIGLMERGPDGPPGPEGPAGPPGISGGFLPVNYSGHGPPPVTIPGSAPGDTYLDMDTGDIYTQV